MKKIQSIGLRLIPLVLFCSISVVLFSFHYKKEKAKNASYNAVFVNKYWNKMHLQVRVGNNSIPENNPLQFDKELTKGASTGNIGYEVLCWYRRDANPNNPDGRFTNWTSTGCFKNTPCVIDNP